MLTGLDQLLKKRDQCRPEVRALDFTLGDLSFQACISKPVFFVNFIGDRVWGGGVCLSRVNKQNLVFGRM